MAHEHIFVSWSSLRVAEECKQKAMLYRRHHRSAAVDIRGYFPGTVVDRVMREWLDNEAREPGEMARRVVEVMDREEQTAKDTDDGIVRWKSMNDRAQVVADCIECVTRLEPMLNRLALPHEFQPAKRFSVPLTVPGPDDEPVQVTLRGEMDLLVRENGTDWSVYDLKMTRDDSYWRKTVMQLVFYDLAVRAGFGRYATKLALLQPMCKQPIVAIEVDHQLRNELVTRIMRMVHDRVLGKEEPKEDPAGCQWCDVRFACIRFQPVGGRMPLVPLTLSPTA